MLKQTNPPRFFSYSDNGILGRGNLLFEQFFVRERLIFVLIICFCTLPVNVFHILLKINFAVSSSYTYSLCTVHVNGDFCKSFVLGSL